MAKGIQLHDGQIINADLIVSVTACDYKSDSPAFAVTTMDGKVIHFGGNKKDVLLKHTEIRRGMGISDPNLVN